MSHCCCLLAHLPVVWGHCSHPSPFTSCFPMLFMLCPSFGLVYAKSLLFGIPCLVEYTLFLIGLPRQYLKHRLCVVPFLFETYISYMKKKITALITVAVKVMVLLKWHFAVVQCALWPIATWPIIGLLFITVIQEFWKIFLGYSLSYTSSLFSLLATSSLSIRFKEEILEGKQTK